MPNSNLHTVQQCLHYSDREMDNAKSCRDVTLQFQRCRSIEALRGVALLQLYKAPSCISGFLSAQRSLRSGTGGIDARLAGRLETINVTWFIAKPLMTVCCARKHPTVSVGRPICLYMSVTQLAISLFGQPLRLSSITRRAPFRPRFLCVLKLNHGPLHITSSTDVEYALSSAC